MDDELQIKLKSHLPDWSTVWGVIDKHDDNDSGWGARGDTYIPVVWMVTLTVNDKNGVEHIARCWVEEQMVVEPGAWNYILTEMLCQLEEQFA